MGEKDASGVSTISLVDLRQRVLNKSSASRPASSVGAVLVELRSAEFRKRVEQTLAKDSKLDLDGFLDGAVRVIEGDQRLLAAEPKSVLGGVLECAAIGLRLGGVMPQAYLSVRNRRNGRGGFLYEADVVLGYRGLIALANRSGVIKSVSVRVVTDREVANGDFDLYFTGPVDTMNHRPALLGDKGEPVMVYCLVRFEDKDFHFESVSREEMAQARAAAIANWSSAEQESPWVTNEIEQWRNLAVRRAFKYLDVPLEGLHRALALEDARERDVSQGLARVLGGEDVAEVVEKAPEIGNPESGKASEAVTASGTGSEVVGKLADQKESLAVDQADGLAVVADQAAKGSAAQEAGASAGAKDGEANDGSTGATDVGTASAAAETPAAPAKQKKVRAKGVRGGKKALEASVSSATEGGTNASAEGAEQVEGQEKAGSAVSEHPADGKAASTEVTGAAEAKAPAAGGTQEVVGLSDEAGGESSIGEGLLAVALRSGDQEGGTVEVEQQIPEGSNKQVELVGEGHAQPAETSRGGELQA